MKNEAFADNHMLSFPIFLELLKGQVLEYIEIDVKMLIHVY